MLKVKVFDESHETDLEDAINMFLEEMDEDSALVDIKYSISAFLDVGGEQIYCYSALLIYREKDK
jgi:hypothetical protein